MSRKITILLLSLFFFCSSSAYSMPKKISDKIKRVEKKEAKDVIKDNEVSAYLFGCRKGMIAKGKCDLLKEELEASPDKRRRQRNR